MTHNQCPPSAFLSYARHDDKTGKLTRFREMLADEIRTQTGEHFPIFQDDKDIEWGENWWGKCEKVLHEVLFLIPILTPSFFKSESCRAELLRFLEREKQLKRDDLILPVYWVGCPLLDDKNAAQDALAATIAERQRVSCRELRFQPMDSPEWGRKFEEIALKVQHAARRVHGKPEVSSPRFALSEISLSYPARNRQLQAALKEGADAARGFRALLTGHPFARTEPTARVVDAQNKGDFASIPAAIQASEPGDRIIIRPGSYKGPLLLNKPLEILGAGDAIGSVVVEASHGPTLRFQTSMGRVAFLTLRQGNDQEPACVDILQGHLDLEHCDITTEGPACVVVRGGANPQLVLNKIHHGTAAGVLFMDGSSGRLENNAIIGNSLTQVVVASHSHPTIRNNRISGGKGNGVLVMDHAGGTIEYNDILDHGQVGVTIVSRSSPTLRHNRIYRNGAVGVMVLDDSGGTFEFNDLRGNRFGAWAIDVSSQSTVVRSENIE